VEDGQTTDTEGLTPAGLGVNKLFIGNGGVDLAEEDQEENEARERKRPLLATRHSPTWGWGLGA
jgi:hypothetical protein